MKKGISLVSLIVTIAVIMTLVGTIAITSTNVYNNTKKIRLASELVYVQELVNTYKINNNGNIPSSKILYIDLSNVSIEDIDEQFKGESIDNNQLALYQIDFDILNAKELFYGNAVDSDSEDIYCISNTTGKVYYIKGLKVGSKTYYTLVDDLKNSIDYVEDNNINDGIIFVYNNNFNNKGEIDIKIPSNYIDISVTSTDSNFSATISNDNDYIVYKTTSDVNSVITVSYKKTTDGEIKKLKYVVSNIDKEAPTFELSDVKTNVNNETGKEEKYIEIENLTDNLSEIKTVKYTNKFIINSEYAKNYFKNKGIDIKDEKIIKISNNMTCITVYVEDQSGNFMIKNMDFLVINNIYQKDGLILHYDGMQNTRNGNSLNAITWEDLSGNNNDGIFVNDNDTIVYKENGYEFTNNSDYIESKNNLGLSSDPNVTVEIVYKWYGFQNSKHSFSGFFTTSNFTAVDGYSLGAWISRSKALTTHSVNAAVSSIIANENIINNISIVKKAGTFNNDTVSIYNNSIKDDLTSTLGTTTMKLKDEKLQIGRGWQFNNQNRTLNGVIYAVRVYSRVLSDEEIKHNYKVDKARFNLE